MNAPTLLVGLGGSGGKIIKRVAAMVTEEQKKNISFITFDTDINELREIQEECPFIRTIQTSTRQTVGDYLSKDEYARNEWFPVNAILNGKALSEGAGQVRSISRLALDTVIRAGKMEPLHQAIQALYKVEEDKVEQALRVIIVGSLAGGTGSGLILPVGLYIKNYLASHFRQSANITRGFFILPEVFFEVIRGTSERNNLRANAYAALRELDAFLMKGDGTLPEKYMDSVKMLFPRESSGGYEEYNVSPYDFCFLFDAQNAEGGKLNSYNQYLDHAANCIYAQSIGPMNKRSNSSEDNTIRKLAKERGRNRYAGAGASMLIYPFEAIKKFIALKWSKHCISKFWLTYDDIYKEICKSNAKENETRGTNIQNPDPYEYYVNQIDSNARQQDDPFASAIVTACTNYSGDGVTKLDDRWILYITSMLNKVKEDIQARTEELESAFSSANEDIISLGTEKEWGNFAQAYEKMKTYYQISINYANKMSATLAYAMFKEPKKGQIDLNLDFRLEKYLVDQKGSFLHPNAIRYLLIKILYKMDECLKGAEDLLNQDKDFFRTFEKVFDDPRTEGVEETSSDLENRKSAFGARKNEQATMILKYREYMNKVEDYKEHYATVVVLRRGKEYVESIIKAFDVFYTTFASKVETIDEQIEAIYKRYKSCEGTTARYVCASKKCLDEIAKQKVYTGSIINIDSDLAQDIYFKVLGYALMSEKPKNNKYFGEVFDNDIIGYYEKKVMEHYSSDIDVDIITAIENEAKYINDYDQDANVDELVRLYVLKVIRDTRELSCPFIESPLGEPREPLDSCAINKDMEPEKGDDSPRAQLIESALMNFGGVADEDIPKNMIMFYKSFYGLRANNLSKFAPSEITFTSSRPSGEYYKAYFELVEGIHPETCKSREISPHIDRWWHIVTKMPDLDEKNQEAQEHRIYAAFFWGIVCRYIEMYDDGAHKKVYKAKKDELMLESDTLIVSNGTECDKLYEVLDAIAIYPELVTKILDKVEARIVYDVNKNGKLTDSLFMQRLNAFTLPEPCLGKELKKAVSIFDIPMMMRKSTVPDEYYEEDVINLLKVELAEVKRYFGRFCNEKELPAVFREFVLNQFDKYIADTAVELEANPSLYRENLFDRTCSIIAGALEEAGLIDEGTFVRDKRDELKMS
ncbi:MAG: hypothetical protein IJZ51_09325 [Ruminiclostridium sp.]|nr:hypothetical protein [Ruminiclostridium sp.]